MNDSLVLVLDFGTSSVRAIVFDARGREVTSGGTVVEAQVKYAQTTTGDGGVEVDAEELLGYSVKCLKMALRKSGTLRKRIAGVGISCFWHSLVGVDDKGMAVTPLMSWADTRSAGHVVDLKRLFDAGDYHSRTGCELHPSFWPAKLLWLRDAEPEKIKRVRRWMGFGEYALQRLFGVAVASLSMASGTGLFNQAKADWDDQVLTALGIDRDQLPALTDCDQPLTGAVDEFRKDLGVLADLPWFPALGDGACSNIGSGGVDEGRIALNVGTSAAMRVVVPAGDVKIEPGLFCYRVDARTVLFGGAFANGGNVHAWLGNTLNWQNDAAIAKLVAKVEPDSHGLTVLPFWSGERSPGWHGDARAAIVGMNLHTTPADIVRASVEACSYSFNQVREPLQKRFPSAKEIVVSGGALAHDVLWSQMLADVFGMPIVMSKVAEASSRGAALVALRSLGVLKKLEDAPFTRGQTFHPDMPRHEVYRTACERYEKLYKKMLEE
jgi:gluconokinase